MIHRVKSGNDSEIAEYRVIPFCLCHEILFLPKTGSDVFHHAICSDAVQPLVGGRLRERTEMSKVGTNLDVIEMLTVYQWRDAQTTAIPRHLEAWMPLVDVLGQGINGFGLCIATHQCYAGDVATEFLHETIDCQGIERLTDVLSQISAVAPRAMAGAARDIH